MLGGAMSPIVQALLMLLMSKGAGGLGDLLGGGHRGEARPRAAVTTAISVASTRIVGRDRATAAMSATRHPPCPAGRATSATCPGCSTDRATAHSAPGDRSAGAGPYAHLDHEAQDGRSGLDGLIDRFQRGGSVTSWNPGSATARIAGGPPDRLADALGSDTVNALQQRTGMNRDDLLSQLAQALPQVINGLTPQGRGPPGGYPRLVAEDQVGPKRMPGS